MTRRIRCRTLDKGTFMVSRAMAGKSKPVVKVRDTAPIKRVDINQIHAEFWAKHKP
jgi:hypothetical protein